MSQKLTMSKDKLAASEKCMLRTKLVSVTSELNEANVKVDDYLSQIKELEQAKADLIHKIKSARNDYETQLEQLEQVKCGYVGLVCLWSVLDKSDFI